MEASVSGQPRPGRPRLILLVPLFVLLLFKVLMRKTLLALFLGAQHAFRHKVSSALVALLLAVLIWTHLQQSGAPAVALSTSPMGDPSLARPPAVETYIKGQSSFDARAMWEAMSQRYQQELNAQGGTQAALQQQLDAARAQGRRFTDVAYVGGYRLNDGRSIYLYVITMGAGGESRQVPYLFTVDQDGKIDNID